MLSALRTAALFVALPLFVRSDETTTLKWHFTKGEVLRYRITLEQTTEMSMMPGGGMQMNMALVMDQTVSDVAADGTATLDLGYEALRLDSDSPMMPMHYDSTHGASGASSGDPEFTKLFDPMLKAKIHMKMDPTGHVSDVSGIQEMLEKLAADMPKGPGAGGAEMIKQMFSEPSLRKMVEVNVFPAKALSVGDTWQRSLEVPNPMIGAMTFAMDNKFLGVEEHAGQPCAKIEVATKVTLGKAPAGDGALKFTATMDDSDGKGTQWFSTKTGRIVEISTTMEMSMTINIPSRDEDPAHGMKMDTTTDANMRTLLLGKDDPAFEPEKKKDAPKK